MFGLPLWITAWLIFYWGCVAAAWIISFSGVLFNDKQKNTPEKAEGKEV